MLVHLSLSDIKESSHDVSVKYDRNSPNCFIHIHVPFLKKKKKKEMLLNIKLVLCCDFKPEEWRRVISKLCTCEDHCYSVLETHKYLPDFN